MQTMESVSFSDDSQDELYSQSMSERVHRVFRRLDFDVVTEASPDCQSKPPKMETLVKNTAHILRDLNHVSTEHPREEFTRNGVFLKNETVHREDVSASNARTRLISSASASGLAQLSKHYASPYADNRSAVSTSVPALKQHRTNLFPPTRFKDEVSPILDLSEPDQKPLDLRTKRKSNFDETVTLDSCNRFLKTPIKKENCLSPCVPASHFPASSVHSPVEFDCFSTACHNETSEEDTLERALAILNECNPSAMETFVCFNDHLTQAICKCFTAANSSSDSTLTCHCKEHKLRSTETESTCQEDVSSTVTASLDAVTPFDVNPQINTTFSIPKVQNVCDEQRIVEGCEVFDASQQKTPQHTTDSSLIEDASERPSFLQSGHLSKYSRPAKTANEEEMDLSFKYPNQESSTERNSSRECWSVNELSPSKPLTLKLSRRHDSSNTPTDMRVKNSDCFSSSDPDIVSQPSGSEYMESRSLADKAAPGDTLSFIVRTSKSEAKHSPALSCVSQPITPELVLRNSFARRPPTPKEINSSTPICSTQTSKSTTCIEPPFRSNHSLRRHILKKSQMSITHDANSVLNLGFTQPDDSKTTAKGKKASILKALKRQILCQTNVSMNSVADVTAAANCLGKLKSSKKQPVPLKPPRHGISTLITACGKSIGDESMSFVTLSASPPGLSTISWCKSKSVFPNNITSTVSPSVGNQRQVQEIRVDSKREDDNFSPVVPTKVVGTSTSRLPLSASTPHAPTSIKLKSRSTSSFTVARAYSSETSPDDNVIFQTSKVPVQHNIQSTDQNLSTKLVVKDNSKPALGVCSSKEIAADTSQALDVLWVNKIGRLTAEWLAAFMLDKTMERFQGRFDQGLNKNLLLGLCARCNIKAEISKGDPSVFTLMKLRHSQSPTEHDLQQCIRQTRRI